MIQFQNADVKFSLQNKADIKNWIKAVIAEHYKKTGDLSLVFCSDKYLLEINRQYLQHDFYTDIITFDYCEGKSISGDLLISVDRVEENAQKLNVPFEEELLRVIIHGILHLIGFKDKTLSEVKAMRNAENNSLALLKNHQRQAQ
ncbi:MAG: rRNA maturation RNase YbeY [Flavobacteriales bacterium]